MIARSPPSKPPVASPGTDARPAYHHGDLRRALIDAATRLIEDGAERRLTLRAAAEAAGVSVAAPYRHFADREALLAEVLTEGFGELAERTEAARQSAGGPLQALEATGLAYVRFAGDRPRLYRLMFGPECDKSRFPALMQAGQEALAVLRHAVADCQAAGLVRGSHPAGVALAGWALSHGLASLHVDGLLASAGTPRDPQALARQLIGMLVDGVRVR